MRYHKQIILNQIGEEGQKKLKRSKVLIVGAGGLGSVVSYYLAASGIGYLGIVDPDVVELSNLQRQIIHNEEHLGMPKVISAMINLKKLNSNIEILPYPEAIDKKKVDEYFNAFDVVVACPDNFKTRFLLNEASIKFQKPLIMGAVSEFEGHVLNIIPPNGPCFNCLFEDATDDDINRGILAPVAGVIGSIQAIETIKILLSIGTPLHGRMLIYDALGERFREVRYSKNSACKICNNAEN